MEKIYRERNILLLAETLLSKLYGDFSVIPEQIDKPDAAIKIKKTSKTIGIEVTSVDKQKDQEYLNNEKITHEVIGQQLNNLSTDGSYSGRAIKKLSIPLPRDYIFESVIKKAEKYQSYAEFGKYEEIIILAFSSYINVNDDFFNECLKPWSNFLLSENEFPFDKVVFISERTKEAIVIYDKSSPFKESPLEDCKKKAEITVAKSSVLPFGKTVNISNLFLEEPHISFVKKSQKQKKSTKLF